MILKAAAFLLIFLSQAALADDSTCFVEMRDQLISKTNPVPEAAASAANTKVEDWSRVTREAEEFNTEQTSATGIQSLKYMFKLRRTGFTIEITYDFSRAADVLFTVNRTARVFNSTGKIFSQDEKIAVRSGCAATLIEKRQVTIQSSGSGKIRVTSELQQGGKTVNQTQVLNFAAMHNLDRLHELRSPRVAHAQRFFGVKSIPILMQSDSGYREVQMQLHATPSVARLNPESGRVEVMDGAALDVLGTGVQMYFYESGSYGYYESTILGNLVLSIEKIPRASWLAKSLNQWIEIPE